MRSGQASKKEKQKEKQIAWVGSTRANKAARACCGWLQLNPTLYQQTHRCAADSTSDLSGEQAAHTRAAPGNNQGIGG